MQLSVSKGRKREFHREGAVHTEIHDDVRDKADGRGWTPRRLTAAAAMLFALLTLSARAQLVPDGGTATINGTSTNLAGNLTVGTNGGNTTLLITNGGRVASSFSSAIGLNPGANNNQVTVTGPTSLWTNSGDLLVGVFGSVNTLLITNGGTVANGTGVIGHIPGANNNQVTVTGTNSVWTNSGDLLVGYRGSANTLLITNGGTVANSFCDIGSQPGASNNQVTVTGPTSLWTNRSKLVVGVSGSFNTLLIANGGKVANSNADIGTTSGASNNQVTVTGPDSLWTNSGDLNVGYVGSFNTLVITNGGRVANSFGFIGSASGASNNQVTVTGPTSLWTNSGKLLVGVSGSSNTLLIANGGTVANSTGVIGIDSDASNNQVTVTGPTSVWTNSGDLQVGFSGSFNTLLITKGGTVQAGNAYVGRQAGISNNLLRLDNGTLTVPGGLTVNSNNTLAGNGTILGTVTNSGTIAPGNSAGSLAINGDLRLSASARLSFEIGGLLATNQYDQLTVTNFVQFAGRLSLTLLPGFLPNPQDSFTLLKFGSFSGAFDNAPFLGRVSLANNLASFAVTYTLTNFSIGGVTYADTDGDGQGDLQELAAGTNPADKSSVLKIMGLARTNPGSVTVTFQSVPGKNYRIEYSNDLTAWSVANTNTAAAAVGNSTQWTDDGSQTGGLNFLIPRRFYRVGLQ